MTATSTWRSRSAFSKNRVRSFQPALTDWQRWNTRARIRSELKVATLPVVALTAGALVGERQRSLEAGMNDFISKPFDPQALIRKVRRLVEQARGAPIAMVVLDTEPSRHAAEGLIMSSIDAGVVQQMFGDDLTMFKSLLARMLRDFS